MSHQAHATVQDSPALTNENKLIAPNTGKQLEMRWLISLFIVICTIILVFALRTLSE